jgi:hypothetical protein
LFLEISDGARLGTTGEALREGRSLAGCSELYRNEHVKIRVSAREGRGFKTLLVQPNPHLGHLTREFSPREVNFDSVHGDARLSL